MQIRARSLENENGNVNCDEWLTATATTTTAVEHLLATTAAAVVGSEG